MTSLMQRILINGRCCAMSVFVYIELDQAVHGNSDRYRLNDKDLCYCD
jgi:hypothetical protein